MSRKKFPFYEYQGSLFEGLKPRRVKIPVEVRKAFMKRTPRLKSK